MIDTMYLAFNLFSFMVSISSTMFSCGRTHLYPPLKYRIPQWISHWIHSRPSVSVHLATAVYVCVTTCSLNNGQFHWLSVASGFHVIFLPWLLWKNAYFFPPPGYYKSSNYSRRTIFQPLQFCLYWFLALFYLHHFSK